MKNLVAFAPPTPNLGELNQIRGIFTALMQCQNDERKRFAFNLAVCFKNIVGGSLRLSSYENYEDFKADVFRCLDYYFSKHVLIPRIFVMAYTQSDNIRGISNVDSMCRAVKEYYEQNRLGWIYTVAVNAKLGDYRWTDLILVAGHMLSEADKDRLAADEELKKKVFVSEGIVHNMSRLYIRQKFRQKKVQTLLTKYKNGKPNVVFVCGGRVAGPEIRLPLENAEKIYAKMAELADKGYNSVILNGPRTPNEVTDYFCEQSLLSGGKVDFYNSKSLSHDKGSKLLEPWRVYRGKFEEKFGVEQKQYGAIYPAILGLENTLAVHSFDSFASCETASSGIPTAICRWVEIDKNIRPDCYRLADLLTNGGYAVDFADFDGRVEPKDLKLKLLPNSNLEFAKRIVKECLV